MIAFPKPVVQLDRNDPFSTAATCYSLAIQAVSQYMPELDPHDAAEFRLHLQDLEDQWRSARTNDHLRAIQASFRGELRQYRDQTHREIARLRQELSSAAAGIALFADGIELGGIDYEKALRKELEQLESAACGNDLARVRGEIRTVAGEISASLERMRRGNLLTIAQLQDEIRVLHRQFQAERRALFTDPASGAWTRQKLDLKISELQRQDNRFSVIAVALCNLPEIRLEHPPVVVDATLKAMLLRFRGLFCENQESGDYAVIGRWSDARFVAVLDVEPAAISSISAELAATLGGPYSIQENGVAHTIVIELAIGAMERACGSDQTDFIRNLEALTESLSN